jgi:hypothetical protein
MDADAAVIMVSPPSVNGAPIFAASWDINSALPLTYASLKNRTITIFSPWGGALAWDGNRLAYPGQPPLATTHHVYVWIPENSSFRKMERPFQIGQDMNVRDLP